LCAFFGAALLPFDFEPFAFFVATGSFFLGQQKILPQAVRGSLILVVMALAPIALMLFWLVWVRFSRRSAG